MTALSSEMTALSKNLDKRLLFCDHRVWEPGGLNDHEGSLAVREDGKTLLSEKKSDLKLVGPFLNLGPRNRFLAGIHVESSSESASIPPCENPRGRHRRHPLETRDLQPLGGSSRVVAAADLRELRARVPDGGPGEFSGR